jgi:hypothetical protein
MGMACAKGNEVIMVAGSSRKAAGGAVNVPVKIAASRIEAELVVGMLRSNGVRAVISADDAGGVEPPLQVQGVRVLVAASEAAEARRLLAAINETSS